MTTETQAHPGPEGHKLMPASPTNEMVFDGAQLDGRLDYDLVTQIYLAMFAAAPAIPAPEGEERTPAGFNRPPNGEPCNTEDWNAGYEAGFADGKAAPAPQAPTTPEGEPLGAHLLRLARKHDLSSDFKAAIRQAAKLLAAPAPQAPAWQPIETAPKDGTAILAFWKPVSGSPASHCYGITEFVEGRWRNPEEDDDYYIDPTHWMPLPAAPQTNEPGMLGTPEILPQFPMTKEPKA